MQNILITITNYKLIAWNLFREIPVLNLSYIAPVVTSTVVIAGEVTINSIESHAIRL